MYIGRNLYINYESYKIVLHSLDVSRVPHSLKAEMSIQTTSWTKASLILIFSIFLGALHIYEKVAIPASLNVFSGSMPQRDTSWAENVVHPTLLWRMIILFLWRRY
jgi:hypothetical protein